MLNFFKFKFFLKKTLANERGLWVNKDVAEINRVRGQERHDFWNKRSSSSPWKWSRCRDVGVVHVSVFVLWRGTVVGDKPLSAVKATETSLFCKYHVIKQRAHENYFKHILSLVLVFCSTSKALPAKTASFETSTSLYYQGMFSNRALKPDDPASCAPVMSDVVERGWQGVKTGLNLEGKTRQETNKCSSH